MVKPNVVMLVFKIKSLDVILAYPITSKMADDSKKVNIEMKYGELKEILKNCKRCYQTVCRVLPVKVASYSFVEVVDSMFHINYSQSSFGNRRLESFYLICKRPTNEKLFD